jgi:hypothetical protein
LIGQAKPRIDWVSICIRDFSRSPAPFVLSVWLARAAASSQRRVRLCPSTANPDHSAPGLGFRLNYDANCRIKFLTTVPNALCPNAFVHRRETSVQSSLRESSFRKSGGARKSQTVHPALFRPPRRLRRSLSAFRPLRRPRWTLETGNRLSPRVGPADVGC